MAVIEVEPGVDIIEPGTPGAPGEPDAPFDPEAFERSMFDGTEDWHNLELGGDQVSLYVATNVALEFLFLEGAADIQAQIGDKLHNVEGIDPECFVLSTNLPDSSERGLFANVWIVNLTTRCERTRLRIRCLTAVSSED